MTGVGVTMATIAVYILAKSKVAFHEKPAVIEFQHSVAAVGLVFCICDIPCSVVYWWRALILPEPLTGVPILARKAQAVFHLINSASNFFIYWAISDRFRGYARQLLQRGRNPRKRGETSLPSRNSRGHSKPSSA